MDRDPRTAGRRRKKIRSSSISICFRGVQEAMSSQQWHPSGSPRLHIHLTAQDQVTWTSFRTMTASHAVSSHVISVPSVLAFSFSFRCRTPVCTVWPWETQVYTGPGRGRDDAVHVTRTDPILAGDPPALLGISSQDTCKSGMVQVCSSCTTAKTGTAAMACLLPLAWLSHPSVRHRHRRRAGFRGPRRLRFAVRATRRSPFAPGGKTS